MEIPTHSTTAENLEDVEESKLELSRRKVKELEQQLKSEISRRKLAESVLQAKRFPVNNLRQDEKVFTFYTGFNKEQFYCLLEFLVLRGGSMSASNSNDEGLGGSKPGPLRIITWTWFGSSFQTFPATWIEINWFLLDPLNMNSWVTKCRVSY